MPPRALPLLLLPTLGCLPAPAGLSDGGPGDQRAWMDRGAGEALIPLFADIAFAGCPRSSRVAGVSHCEGVAPLALTLLPVTPGGVASWFWETPGGEPASSRAAAVAVRFAVPGSYEVTLVVGGGGGTANARARIEVRSAPLGAACDEDRQCGTGYCLCGAGHRRRDGGDPCPDALAVGLCTELCSGGGCGPGALCVDLGRSARDADAAGDPWRRPICLPACVVAKDCRAGFACRSLPALTPGAPGGGAFSWKGACFPSLLGDIGARCADPGGNARPSNCLSGDCLAVGARGLCSASCAAVACPPGTACATFRGAPGEPRCLRRCAGGAACDDPLLACAAAGGDGGYAFTVPPGEPPGTTYCAPRRCAGPGDCAPAGSCGVDGGAFCRR